MLFPLDSIGGNHPSQPRKERHLSSMAWEIYPSQQMVLGFLFVSAGQRDFPIQAVNHPRQGVSMPAFTLKW